MLIQDMLDTFTDSSKRNYYGNVSSKLVAHNQSKVLLVIAQNNSQLQEKFSFGIVSTSCF